MIISSCHGFSLLLHDQNIMGGYLALVLQSFQGGAQHIAYYVVDTWDRTSNNELRTLSFTRLGPFSWLALFVSFVLEACVYVTREV